MFGMETMSDAVAPLAQNEKFTGILTIFSNPLFGLFAGTVLKQTTQSVRTLHTDMKILARLVVGFFIRFPPL